MPVKSLESFLFERGLVGTYPIESLKNATLGIDVDHYVSRLLTSKREQYLDAIGGFPTSLKLYLESDLQVFREFDITPIFVFSGSPVANQLEANGHYAAAAPEAAAAAINASNSGPMSSSATSTTRTAKEAILAQRHKGWTQWNNMHANNQSSYIDQPVPPSEPFKYSIPLDTKRFQSDLIDYFISLDIRFQVAPYSSWFQLTYLLQNEYIDAIYGPTELLMLKSVEKFILGMEFPNKEYRFVDRARVLSEINCSPEEFVDICMTVGNDLQPYTLSPLRMYPVQQLFEVALEMVLTSGTDFYAYQLMNPIKSESIQSVARYQKGISALKFMPVLKENGKVELYSPAERGEDRMTYSAGSPYSPASSTGSLESIPNDVHDVVAQRLPHEYYFYQSIGLVSGKLMDAITTGVYPDEPPLDGGSSESYRKLVKNSVELFKNKEINLLTQPINRYYQIKPIKHVKWFAPDDAVTLANRVTPPIFDRINHLIVKISQPEREFSLAQFLTMVNESGDLTKSFVSDKVLFPNSVPLNEKLATPFDVLATAFIRFLSLLGFFDFDSSQKTLKVTPWGRILLDMTKTGVDSESIEPVFVLLMFLKTGVLSLREETVPATPSALSKATLRSYSKESSYILVLTRILSIFRLQQKPSNYHGPIDRKTLVFRDHLDYVKENLNDLFEVTLVSSLAAGEFDRLSLDNTGWQKKIVAAMPFKLSTPSTVMAMIWQFYLQKFLHNGNSKSDALNLIASTFNTSKVVPNLDEELKRSLDFARQFGQVLGALSKANLCEKQDYELVVEAVEFAEKAFADERV
ncbi:Mkt1p [Lachancea thermotolerans CBS 6340]|uniref:KLTH0G08426p n=1 Tax=Lachancea thermotolerans (strain ATCC 56472 / CBS 6340 / NRRL Y-8284) TaxID=559295 RepID=C5DMF4_LACTC|nr:KLTH0G08426p [Lachancea thermotolerans CBS 6340]CAR24965.1 KLTH0G08426p [Lachancea thermotolerans CBS 6340]